MTAPLPLRLGPRGFGALLGVLTLALAVALAWGLAVGAVSIPVSTLVDVLSGERSTEADIVLELRAPRLLMAALVGGTLAAVGATLQAIMRNELADPYILGVSSGAAIGVSLSTVAGLGVGAWGSASMTVAAFITALASVAVVYRVARVEGTLPPLRLLLAGVAWSSFATAVSAFILYLAPRAEQLRSVFFWLIGGLSATSWRDLLIASSIALPSLALILVSARWQTLLLLGDETAHSLGLNAARARKRLVLLCALATATTVAAAGAIGFIGLIVPHALRPFVGPRASRLLPASILSGALLLVCMDTGARTLLAPRELPVGILTGLLGAPFFLVLLWRNARVSPPGP